MKRLLDDMHTDMDLVEREIILTVIEDALKLGYKVTVHDGIDVVAERSDSKEEIFSALYGTSFDTLFFHQGDEQIGWVSLIYGNQECVVSDASDNAAIDALLKNADALTEKYS